jgi:hypothetical protein
VSINRTQAVVLGFVAAAWLTLILVLVAAPDVFAGALRLQAGGSRVPELAFLIALTAFLGLLGLGVVRRWRWLFWLILSAFLAGVLRVPASALELAGVLPMTGPAWYLVLQAGIGLVQFGIGLAMLSDLRRAGVWGRRAGQLE